MNLFEKITGKLQIFGVPAASADSRKGPTKIMLIRHAEKPDGTGAVLGVDASGRPDPNQLSVRGWQRAGALVRFFAPIGKGHAQGIATPSAIFACNGTNSVRSFSTVSPLATALRIPVNTMPKSNEGTLIDAIRAASGAVLICWSHEPIPGIVRLIAGESPGLPVKWPGKRFDLVWILDRVDGRWRFSQIGQLLLPEDTHPAQGNAVKMEPKTRPECGIGRMGTAHDPVAVLAGPGTGDAAAPDWTEGVRV